MGSDGRALVVWEQVGARGSRIVTSARTTQGAWSAPRPISPLGARPVSSPQVSMNARGDAVVTWQRSGQIFVATRTAAGRWSAQRRVSLGGGPAAFPRVAVTVAGRAYVVWQQRHGIHDRVLVVRRTLDGHWSQPTGLPSGFGDAVRPQVGVDAHGHALVAWQRMWGDGGRTAVLVSRRTEQGWGATRRLSNAGVNAGEPVVSVNDGGQTVVAWSARQQGELVVLAVVRPPSGPWRTIRIAAHGQLGGLVLGENGTAFVAWTRQVGEDARVGATRHPAGGSWRAGQLVSSPGRDATVPTVAQGGGTVTVAWLSGVPQAVRRVDGVWGPVEDLAALPADSQQVAMDRAARAVVVWKRLGAAHERITVSSREPD
jgi:hypothetical protein